MTRTASGAIDLYSIYLQRGFESLRDTLSTRCLKSSCYALFDRSARQGRMGLRTVVAPIEHQRQGAPLVARNGTYGRATARPRRALRKGLLRSKRSVGNSGGPLCPALWLAVLSHALRRVKDAIGFDGASEVVGLRLRGVDQAISKAGAPNRQTTHYDPSRS